MSRLRWMPEAFRMPKLLLTCNPSLGWVRDRFVKDKDGHPAKLREGEFYCPFTIDANPDKNFRRVYIANLNRIKDAATRERLRWGNWDFVDANETAAYWNFKGEEHLVDNLKEQVYDPLKPLIISFDFNVAPFMSSLAIQIDYEKKNFYVLEEVLGRPEDKENNTPKLARKISNKYLAEGHMGGLIITGDPAGLQRSTQTEDDTNNYSIIQKNLHPSFHSSLKLFSKQPPQKTRLEFINSLFENLEDWHIFIDMRCRRLTEDMVYQKTNSDGTKDKSKVLDAKLGIKYEKYGHVSDCMDYAICMFLSDEWKKFQKKISYGIATVGSSIYNVFDY